MMEWINQNQLNIMENDQNAFDFALKMSIIDKEQTCDYNHGKERMILVKDSNCVFKKVWRCRKCGKKRSVLYGSVFYDSKIPISTMLRIVFCWAYELSVVFTSIISGVSEHSISSVFQQLRNACFQTVFSGKQKMIGGIGKTIEIDETLMSKRKYNRGRLLNDQWIFGGICRETNEFFAYLVPDRKGETLLKIIEENILPGTTLYSDQWSGYSPLDNLPNPPQFIHFTVNHSKNFVDPITKVHTQKIERLWRELKRIKHRYNGIPRNQIDLHLAEFLWRKKTIIDRDWCFFETLKLLKDMKFQ